MAEVVGGHHGTRRLRVIMEALYIYHEARSGKTGAQKREGSRDSFSGMQPATGMASLNHRQLRRRAGTHTLQKSMPSEPITSSPRKSFALCLLALATSWHGKLA